MICISTTWFIAALIVDLWVAVAIGFLAAALFRSSRGER
jgi:hypothetical protein